MCVQRKYLKKGISQWQSISHLKKLWMFDIEAIEKDFNIEKEQPVFLYCDTGSTSMLAAKKLDSVGIHAYSVVGGIMFYKGYLEKEKNDLWTMVRTS